MAISGTREARSQEIRLEEITQREEENFIKSLFPAGEDSLGGLGSGGGDFPSQGQQGQGDFLPVAGGTMLGAIAFYPKLIEIADGHIDIGKEIGQFTSRVILNAEGAPTTDNIVAILNAQHAGQFLVIQGTTGETITIKDVSSAETAWATSTVYSAGDEVSNGGSIYVCHTGHTSSASDEPGVGANWEDFWYKGNLMTVDGNNFSLVGEDNLIFMFDSVSNTWRQITTGAQGITSGANKELSNLNVTSINEHLIPQAGKNLGDAGNLWSSLYANHLRLGTAGTLLGSENMIIADATNGIEINVPSGDIVRFYENAVAGPWISSAVLDMSSFNTNIKSGGLELYDFTTDPITNGEFRRNGVDVKVYSGGAVRNLSDITVGGGADRQLTNLIADTAINQDLIPDPAESGLLNLGGGGANENWNVVYADRFNAIAEGYTTSTPGYKRGLNDEIYIDIPLTSGSFDVRENGTGVLGTTTAGTDPWLRFHVLANGGILQLFGTGVAGEDTLIKLGTGTDASEIKYDNDGDFTLNNLAGGVTRGVNVLNNGLSSFNMRSDRNYSNQILNMQAKLMEQVGDLHPDTGAVRSIGNSAGPQNEGFNMYLYEILGWAGNPTDTFIKMTNGSVTEAIEIRTNIAGDDIAIRTNGASSDINVEYTQFLNLGTSTFPSIVQYASNSVIWNSFDRTSNVNLFMQTNYIDIASQTIASVGTPAVGNRRIFVDSVTGELSIKKNDLSVVSLEGGGGGIPHADGNGATDIIENTTDPTKTLRYDLSNMGANVFTGIASLVSGSSKTITIPNITGTLMLLSGAQTISGVKDFNARADFNASAVFNNGANALEIQGTNSYLQMNSHSIEFKVMTQASVADPGSSGEVRLFNDSDNNNKLSVKRDDNIVVPVQGDRMGTAPNGTGLYQNLQPSSDFLSYQPPANEIFAIPWIPKEDCTVQNLTVYVNTAGSGAVSDVMVGIYGNDPTTSPGNYPTVKIAQISSALACDAVGAKVGTISGGQTVLGGYLYWIVLSAESAGATDPILTGYDGGQMPTDNIGLTTSDMDSAHDAFWGWKATTAYSTTMISIFPGSATGQGFTDDGPAVFVRVTVP